MSVIKQLEDKVSQLNNQIKMLGTEIERINRDLAGKVKENDDLRKKIAKLET